MMRIEDDGIRRDERGAGDYLPHVVRGVLMGGADIVPGVSGGTVALILGIYRRLVSAISRFDLTLVDLLRRGEWKQAVRRVDLFFLMALGTGIVSGIVSLASLMHSLLENATSRGWTLAVFFGLILSSGLLVARMVSQWNPVRLTLLLFGAVFAYWLTGLTAAAAEPTPLYVFFSGAIAICAMILPGISGAYILLLLGMYVHVTGAIKGLPKGDLSADNLSTIVLFCAGCGIGLLAFSKLLRWLLARHESDTMAILAGFMVGSLRKIWPFQRDLTPEVHELKLKRFVNEMPPFDATVAAVAAVIFGAALAVFLLDAFARRYRGDL